MEQWRSWTLKMEAWRVYRPMTWSQIHFTLMRIRICNPDCNTSTGSGTFLNRNHTDQSSPPTFPLGFMAMYGYGIYLHFFVRSQPPDDRIKKTLAVYLNSANFLFLQDSLAGVHFNESYRCASFMPDLYLYGICVFTFLPSFFNVLTIL
jgi:hypothetical protein